MANNNKKEKPLSKDKSILNMFKYLDKGMEDAYKTTYYSSKTNSDELNSIQSGIEDNIDSIISKVSSEIDITKLTRLVTKSKINSELNSTEYSGALEELMSDDLLLTQISSSYRDLLFIKEQDDQIDTLCKYCPKLEDAINTKLDNVFSADHFTKDFININGISINGQHIDTTLQKLKLLKQTYGLEDRYEKWGYNTSKYGEQFVYIVPYDKALQRQLRNRDRKNVVESVNILNESAEEYQSFNGSGSAFNIEGFTVKLNCNHGYVLNEVVNKAKLNNTILEAVSGESFYTEFVHEVSTGINENKQVKFNKTIPDDSKFEFPDATSNDGLISSNKEQKIVASGCIIEELDRYKVKPIIIQNDICLGYYHIEMDYANMDSYSKANGYVMMQNSMSFSASPRKTGTGYSDESVNDFLNKLAADLSKNIDAKFINANLDLKKEIYLMLKHHNVGSGAANGSLNVNVTFIPPEDMIHMYNKLDNTTKRGVSDLADSIIPGMLYAAMYLTASLGTITRGQDKRVYYVKQNIETNISKTMLNVVNQIKKGNFNIRSLNSMYNVLDIVGRYNDYIIPLSKSGDPPISFEVMPGQQIELKQEICDLLESSMLNPTHVTKEIIEARDSLDYAIQATMSNTKFLRHILKRQAKVTPFLSRATTMIYNYEYGTNEVLEVSLPAPQILNITNINQKTDANNTYINNLIDSELSTKDDVVKAIFKRKMGRYLSNTDVPYDVIDKLVKESELEFSSNNDNQEE